MINGKSTSSMVHVQILGPKKTLNRTSILENVLAHGSQCLEDQRAHCEPPRSFICECYCGWLRNPAPPKGCLKHYESMNDGMNHLSTGAGLLPSTVPLDALCLYC